jgi:hypothetical protein
MSVCEEQMRLFQNEACVEKDSDQQFLGSGSRSVTRVMMAAVDVCPSRNATGMMVVSGSTIAILPG